MKKVIIDGNNAILGRLGTVVAKELLKGNEVVVINSEKVVISGKKGLVVEKIRQKQRMGRGGSMKGPKYLKVADRLLKRMIRGMLPWDRAKGREAYKRLRCYIENGNLKEEDLKDAIKLNHKKPHKTSTMKEIVSLLKSE
jgi:large subunit ribosomal protein L13